MKKLLLDCDYAEILDIVSAHSQPAYRAGQLFEWLHLGCDFAEMTNLPKVFLNQLSTSYDAINVAVEHVFLSKDGSKKYLFRLADGNLIESIFMPHSYGNSVCLSTQVGCRMRCTFCASGLDGLVRNLSAGEILAQALLMNKAEGATKNERKIKNIVLMGSGEPLDNYDNVIKFLGLVTSEKGINISARNISLSTSGLADGIVKLADSGYPVTLSISLHATTDEQRNKTMPISKKYTIKEIMTAAKYYFERTGRRIIIEYILLKENTDYFDVKRLSELLKGIPAHINLIPLNPITPNPTPPNPITPTPPPQTPIHPNPTPLSPTPLNSPPPTPTFLSPIHPNPIPNTLPNHSQTIKTESITPPTKASKTESSITPTKAIKIVEYSNQNQVGKAELNKQCKEPNKADKELSKEESKPSKEGKELNKEGKEQNKEGKEGSRERAKLNEEEAKLNKEGKGLNKEGKELNKESKEGSRERAKLNEEAKEEKRNESGIDERRAKKFLERLTEANLSATIRKSKAPDISGACGQLRRKFVGCSGTTSSGQKD